MPAASQRQFNAGKKRVILRGQLVSKSQTRFIIPTAYDIEILVDSGAYQDAAWLSADVGLFLETVEMYTELDKYGKGLVGYARGKQFKLMFNYLTKYIPDLLSV